MRKQHVSVMFLTLDVLLCCEFVFVGALLLAGKCLLFNLFIHLGWLLYVFLGFYVNALCVNSRAPYVIVS